MSGFYEYYNRLACRDADFDTFTPQHVQRALSRDKLGLSDFAALLSPAARPYLEDMAQRSHALTARHFGRTVLLYAPLYLSNYCTGSCVYCGFAARNKIHRMQLTIQQVREECRALSQTGIRHVILLTGDAPKIATPEYIAQCAAVAREYFSSVAVEVYAMTQQQYAMLIESGVDLLTIYQETYDEKLYASLHPGGAKSDYMSRLDAPEHACAQNIRGVNVGALLGLNAHWRRDALAAAAHAYYLQDKYPAVEVSLSLPRMRPHAGKTQFSQVSDADTVQFMTAFRMLMPRAGITISTREDASLRDNLIPLGVTKMSAGSKTTVGGYASDADTGQFEISDERSVQQVYEAVLRAGYQPIFKNNIL